MDLTNLTEVALLNLVDEERGKFTLCDDGVLLSYVEEAVKRGIYPAFSKTGMTAFQMVNGWGANWHKWTGTLECPSCKADFRDQESGPPFQRQLGISGQDRVIAWKCPDCGHVWERNKGE